VHGVGNVVVVALFALSFLVRMETEQYLPDVTPMLLGVAGGLIALVTAWLGGELVYRLGVGVDADANLNASNSLTSAGPAEISR
jgi:uncharacterized membrane protein